MEELAHMGSAVGREDDRSPTTSEIPHGTQKIISTLLPWTCTRQKKHQLAIKRQNARGQGCQEHLLKNYKKIVFRNKQAGIATNMCSRIILEKQGITSW
jgi:hypothetical protein